MLRGHLPVFHDLLDLGSFVLKPDFHLGGGTKAHVTGTLRGCPRLSLGGVKALLAPRLPSPGISQQLSTYGHDVQPHSRRGVGPTEGALASSGSTRLQLG